MSLTQPPQTQAYDEVTFALYFDHELDEHSEAQFEAALAEHPELLTQYQEWVDTQELLSAHFNALEDSYELSQFTDQVMEALPEQVAWERQETSVQPEVEVTATTSGLDWMKRIAIPFLVGSLVAAALFIAFNQDDSDNQSNAEIEQQERQGLVPINTKGPTWLEDDDEEDDDDDKGGGI